MSKAIQNKLAKDAPEEDKALTKTFVISEIEMNYLKDIDTVKRSFEYYSQQLSSNYIKQVSMRFGYAPDKNLKYDIDLKDPKRELTITEVYIPKSHRNQGPPLHKD